MSDIVHMKMITGEEVLATMVSWLETEDDDSYIIQGALVFKEISMQVSGSRYYILKPWLLYHEDYSKQITLNPDSVVAFSTPDKEMIDQYMKVIDVYQRANDTLDSDQLQTADGSEQLRELNRKLREALRHDSIDSDQGNIVVFPGNDRIN